MMRYTNRSKPRVKIHAEAQATLAGVDYRDLRQILTAAALHYHYSMRGPRNTSPDLCNERLALSCKKKLSDEDRARLRELNRQIDGEFLSNESATYARTLLRLVNATSEAVQLRSARRTPLRAS